MQKIYKNIITALSGLLIGISVIFIQTTPVQAQQNLELTISPPVAYLKVAPGTMQTHTVSIKNNGDSSTRVTPKIVDFRINPEDGNPYLLTDSSFPYFTMPDAALKPITIEPDQVAQLQLRIEPPATAEEREYPLSVIFSSGAEENISNAESAKITGALASNLVILVSEKNQLEKKLVVENFGAPRVVDSFRGFTITPVLKNERFSTSAATGSAKLSSWTGSTVAEHQIYPDNILGFSSRPIRAMIEENNGETPKTTPFIFNPTFMIGPYNLSIILDNDGSIETTSFTIIALPFSIIIAIIIGLVVGAIYWYRIRTTNILEI